MIKTEHPFEGNEGLIKTYTDLEGKVLLQVETGIVYGNEVIDAYPCRYTYEEVDNPDEEYPEEVPAEDAE